MCLPPNPQAYTWGGVRLNQTLHPTLLILHPTTYTLHPTLYTLHPTPYILRCTLNPNPTLDDTEACALLPKNQALNSSHRKSSLM